MSDEYIATWENQYQTIKDLKKENQALKEKLVALESMRDRVIDYLNKLKWECERYKEM